MGKFRTNCGTWGVKLFLLSLFFLFLINNSNAATVDWKGNTSTDWGTGSNWSTGSQPASGDAVRIGVVSYKNQPILNSGATTTIASLTFGVLNSTLGFPITLTVNSTSTLAVTGAILQNASSTNYGTFITTIAGAGSITCASLKVGDGTNLPPLGAANNLQFTSTITSFYVSGNVTVNSNDTAVLFLTFGDNNATFSLQGGTATIDGTILTVNTQGGVLPFTSGAPKFSVDMPTGSALTPVLKLTNAAAINTGSVTGSIDFYNNTGGTGTCTVYYSGTSQTVYTSTTGNLDASPQMYQYLYLTGAGTKTVGASSGGTLTVGSDLTSSASTVLFNTYNPTVTIGNNWTNSSNATQGSGNITVSNLLQNNSNTITCGTGTFTIGLGGFQLNGGAFTAAGGTVTDNGFFQNNGGALNCGSGSIIFNGLYQNNSGTFTASTGTVYFSSSSARNLSDASATGTTFNNVTFNGTNTATMTAGGFAVSPTGILTMVSPAKLVAGSASVAYLTLKSDTTGAATVAAISGSSSITGFVAVQRFVQGSALYDAVKNRWKGRNYRLMSSPVNEGNDGSGNYPYSLNYLAASTIVTDCTSSYGTTAGNPSLYLFNEHYTPSNATYTSGNFIGVTNINNTLATGHITTTDATNGSANVYVGAGYMMYFRGDKVTHLSSKTTYPYVSPESVVFSATGNLNQGSYSVRSWTGAAGLLYTTTNAGNSTVRGYNLVGNPYPSSIDWSTFSNSSSGAPIYGANVDPTIYILNPTTNNYDTYIAGGTATGSASKIIPSGQGFFVHANNSSPTLTFNESAKTNTEVTGSNLLMSTPAPAGPLAVQQLLRLKLVTDSLNYDDIVIGFKSTASAKYNGNEDAEYLAGSNSIQGLSSFSSDSVRLAINSLPLPRQTRQVIRLDVDVKSSGLYTLQRTELDAIPPIYQVWLMDSYKKDSLDIRNNTTYAFNADLTDTASFGSNRFQLVIRQDPALGLHLLSFTAAKTSGGAQLIWKTENEQNYTNFTVERSTDNGTTFDVLGGFASAALGTYSYLDKNPIQPADQYRLKMEDLNGTITYSNVVALVYSGSIAAVPQSNISVYPNPVSGTINLAINQQGTQSSKLYTLRLIGSTRGSVRAPATHSYNIKIINITGTVIKTAISMQPDWQDNVSALVPGTYIIQVVDKSNNSEIGKSMFTKL